MVEQRPTTERRRSVRLPGPAWRWTRLAPFGVAIVLLVLGYLHYAPGAAYSLSASAYRTYAFPNFRYSDLIWLYLRDDLASHPFPYVDYPLEYPPLTGLVSYLLSFAPNLPSYYALAYLTLAVSALGTIWALTRLPGTNPWFVAATPALFFYTGHQWDGLAVFVSALSLLAFVRGRDRWGAVGIAVGVSLKLFPLVFLAAVVIDRLRQRRVRAVAEISGLFALATVLFNLPFALANFAGWSFFFRWNRDRLADAGFWVLWRDMPTSQATLLSMAATAVGGLVICAIALRARGSVLLPLGATLLLWWLLVNKTFTTHLVLWVFLALALLRVPWLLWTGMVAVDVAAFQLGNFLNLPNVPDFRDEPLILKAVFNLYDPLQLVRSVLLLVAVGWGIRVLLRGQPAPIAPWLTAPATGANGDAAPALVATPNAEPKLDGAGNGHEPGSLVTPDIEIAANGKAAATRPRTLAVATRWRGTDLDRRRIAWGVLVVAIYTIATVVMTWPYAAHLRDATVVGFDPLLQIWLSRWVQHALVSDPLGFYNANIFYPFAQTLAYTDVNVPGALLAAPLDLLTGDPILTNSLLVLATFVFAAAGMHALVAHLTRNRAAALLAGLAYAFLPFRMIHLWHLNWLESAWLPWLFLALLRLIQRPTRGRAVLLGVLVAVLILTSFYFAVQIAILAGLTLAAALIAEPGLRNRRLLSNLVLAMAVAALLAVPPLLPYLQVRSQQGLERTIDEAEHYKATAWSYLTIPPWDRPNPVWGWLGQRTGVNDALLTVGQAVHRDGHQHAEIVIEDALFPGGLALVGAVIGLAGWRRRRWLPVALGLTAVVAVVLSLGPSWGPRDGSGFPLPYRFLFDHAPFFTAMRVPARIGGLADFAIVVLAGLGVAWAWAWLQSRSIPRLGRPNRVVATGLAAGLAVLVLFDLYAAPIPLEAVDRSPNIAAPYEWLATQPDAPAMEFPAESIFADPAGSSVRRHVGLTMFWSTLDWKPLVNGNSGFIPQAYSDLIEAFVGDVPRADGSVAQRISHVDARTAALLQQLGVRYLIFHRSQYLPQDWPAVQAQLDAAEGVLERVGDFGEATIYVVRPVAPQPPRATLTLFAPTLLTPDAPWAPSFVVEKPGDLPSLLSLTRPASLTMTWYDVQGRQLWRSGASLPLPVVVKDEQLLCTVAKCTSATDADYPDDLPTPKPLDDAWRPTAPGHYVVRLVVTGDRPLDCKVDLDVVEDADAVTKLSPGSPYRWAECVASARNPVNNPGMAAFRSPSPSITFVGGRVALEATLVTRQDEEIQGWFTLAPPGSPAPWLESEYQSPVQQRLVRAGVPADFDWLENLKGKVPPGVYGLTIWFHHRTAAGWEHAYGGTFQLSPVVVDANGSVRWAGPVRLTLDDGPTVLEPGRSAMFEIDVSGRSATTGCDASWRLVTIAERQEVAAGHAGRCDRPEIDLPATVSAGRYRLEIAADAVRDERRSLSDELSLVVTVTDGPRNGEPR